MTQPTISTFSVTKGGKVAETFACFREWDLSLSVDDNFDRFQRDNPILAPTEAWLKEMRRIFHVRFSDIELHEPLIRMAKSGMAQRDWAPLLLWHLAMRELLVADFLENWLFPRKEEGLVRVRSEDVLGYLQGLQGRGLIDRQWTEHTVSRMASGLPRYVADFGLLAGGTVKELASFRLPDEALLYVLHAMAEGGAAAGQIIQDRRWRLFLMSSDELAQELQRLHQFRKVHFEQLGTVVSLQLTHPTLREHVAAACR